MEGCKLFFNPIYRSEQQQEILDICKSEGTIVDQWLSRPPKHFMFVTMANPDEARVLADRLNNALIDGSRILCQISHDPPDANFETKRSQHSAREPREFAPPAERYPPRGYHDRAPPPASYDRYPPPASYDRYPPRDSAYPPRYDPAYPPRHEYPPPRRDFDYGRRPPYDDRHSYAPPPQDSYGRDRERSYDRPPGGYEDRRYPAYEPRPYDRRDNYYEKRPYDKYDRRDRKENGICYNCNRPGHTSHTCPLPPTAQDQCYFCREMGHKLRDCPNRNSAGPIEKLPGYDKARDTREHVDIKHEAPRQDSPQEPPQQHHQPPPTEQAEAGYDYDYDQYN